MNHRVALTVVSLVSLLLLVCSPAIVRAVYGWAF